jgi:glycosyltransferase involved in cell wall biosynthesis
MNDVSELHGSGCGKSATVSAVIPTRNRSGLVGCAVESALNQTYPVLEVIVVIDGEDCTTESALATFEDPRLRVICLSKSVGGGGARNIGAQAAIGEWVAFLDDDDVWYPRKLEKQLTGVNPDDDRLIVSCQCDARTVDGRVFVWPRRAPRDTEPISDYLFVRSELTQGEGLLQTSCILTSKALLSEIPFTADLPRHQEWDWLLRASSKGAKVSVVMEPLVRWEIEGPRVSISKSGGWQTSLAWAESIRPHFTARSYASFLLVIIGAIASRDNDRKASFILLRKAFQSGKPRGFDLVLFGVMSIFPQRIRRSLRNTVQRLIGRTV